MDNLTQKTLDGILNKEPLALTQTDISFLKARKSYLTDEQIDKYSSVFEQEPVEVSKPQNRDNRSRSYRAMQKQLAALGHHVVGVPKAQLERMMDTIVGPQQ